MTPRGVQVDPKGFQEGLKSCQIAVQEHLHCKRARTSNLHDPTALFEGLERSGRAAGGQVRGHFAAWRAKLRLEDGLNRQVEPNRSPNRLGQCDQCRLYRTKWRSRGQAAQHKRLYRAHLGRKRSSGVPSPPIDPRQPARTY